MRPRLLLVIGLIFAACARHGAVDTKAPIIIISIDTLRSDHLPAYGYSKVETPNLDAFRKDAILFQRAYAVCPLTLVSHASVLTGLLPTDHGIRDNLGYNLNPKARTIAELLKTKGYATGAAVSAVVLRGDSGLKRGFDFWDEDIDLDTTAISIGRSQRNGDVTREAAQKWIGEHKAQPFFFLFHIYEPHSPYEPPEPFKTKYGNSYDGEVAAADAIVGRFLDYLKEQGLYDRATIVLMSDHGEGLGEHGEEEHGILLYREDLQVPLMLKLPSEAQHGQSVATPVQLLDIFPTIAGAFGFHETLEGRSLLDAADGKVAGDRPLYAETYYPRLHFGWNDLHSIIAGSDHYIHAPKPELYDLAADPAELTNVLADKRRVYAALRERIQPYIHAAAAPSPVDEEQKQQLAALGYVGSTVSTKPDEVLPDPKENIGKANDINRAYRAYISENYSDADRLTTALLHDNPHMIDIWTLRARVMAKLNRMDEAIDCAKEGLKLSPGTVSLAGMVASFAIDAQRYDEAEQHARLTLKETPFEAHQLLSQVWLGRKDYAKARQEAQAAAQIHPGRPSTSLLMARINMESGDPQAALNGLEQTAAELTRRQSKPMPKLNFYRGDALARLGRADEAEGAFREEIRLFPSDPQAYKNLILLYTMAGKTRQATELVFSLEKASPTPPAYLAISQTLKAIGDVNGARFWAARGLSRFPADRQLQAAYRG
ncbi:MAG TPA: sulfatase-like hydrolase/transferase [Thermoanaerobaculia bacterium]|nr:sulfatase-like hydrolase/transferase [Thermoanaerobaculia bacterium]